VRVVLDQLDQHPLAAILIFVINLLIALLQQHSAQALGLAGEVTEVVLVPGVWHKIN